MNIFTDMIGLIVLIVGSGIVALTVTAWNRWRAISNRERFNKLEYIVFETERSELALLESDLARIGWGLSETSQTDSAQMLYRFEKKLPNAANWGRH